LKEEIESLLALVHGKPREVERVDEEPAGPQGASGSRIGYYRVASRDSGGGRHEERVVTKEAPQLERRILRLLAEQGCAVPPMVVGDFEAEGRATVFMPYLEERPAGGGGGFRGPWARSVAEGLAGIHAANRGRRPAWLPPVEEDLEHRLELQHWRGFWEEAARDPEFPAELRGALPKLEAAHERLLATLRHLIAEGGCLTLLNVDLIPDSIRCWRDGAVFLDWEQAGYGPLYLDLPNQIPLESALIYREALARAGYEIPVTVFLERYHEVGRYMGLRYIAVGLWNWLAGGQRRADGLWFLHYTFHLALRGR
jgi:aminoglycoside phosphotransferase (APT) family kinase protein